LRIFKKGGFLRILKAFLPLADGEKETIIGDNIGRRQTIRAVFMRLKQRYQA
jgi:hypothetical protein